MKSLTTFSELQVEYIRKLAEEKRRALGFVGDIPIAREIFTILETMKIILLEYPILSKSQKPAFSAALMYSKEGDEELIFIGLNTADYFDRQVFAIAHELYHFFTKTGSHLSRVDEESTMNEALANRFAAEFLLPESALVSIVIHEFRSSSLRQVNPNKLLRFIARLQCTWWLPYRSLVKRLKEIGAIDDEQYEALYSIDERDINGEYAKLGKAVAQEVFQKLNATTDNISASPQAIEVIIRNFEDNLIGEDTFFETLRLFNKKPSDFGYDCGMSDDDIAEFEDFFKQEGAQDEGQPNLL